MSSFSVLWKGIIISFATIVFGASVWYMINSFHWSEIWRVLIHANVYLLFGAGGIAILLYFFVRAIRWHLLLKELDINIPFFDLYECTVLSIGFANFTPFQSGEVAKIELLRKYGRIDRYPGYSTFMVERFLDLFVVIALATVSILSGVNLGIESHKVLGLCGVVFLLAFGCIYVVWAVDMPGGIGRFQKHARDCVHDLRTLAKVTGLTVLGWGITAAGWFACLKSVGVELSYIESVMITSVMTLVNIASLIPGALGVSEAGITLMLISLGYSELESQAGSLILRFFTVMVLLPGLVHLALWKVRDRR